MGDNAITFNWSDSAPHPTITVRVTLLGLASSSLDRLSGQDWWNQLSMRAGITLDKGMGETALKYGFPEKLKGKWLEHFSHDRRVSLISFRVPQIEYGSLLLPIEIIGLRLIVDLLAGDYHLFKELFETFVATALSESLIGNQSFLYTTPASLEFSFFPSSELITAFSTSSTISTPNRLQSVPTPPPANPSSGQGQDEGQSRLVRNLITLVKRSPILIPVLLSIYVIYGFVVMNTNLRSLQNDFAKLMLEQQKAFIEAQTRRNSEMERLTIDVLRQAAQPSTAKTEKDEKAEKAVAAK